MPRKEPITTIDVLGKPDVIPQDVCGDYIESTQQEKLFIKEPIWDSTGISVEEFYFDARQEHHATLHQQKELLEHQAIQTASNNHRMRRQQQAISKLRKDFMKVNNFIRDFEDKRKSAMKKGAVELELQENMRETNKEYMNMLDILMKFRDELLATTEQYEPYERVLEDVVKQSPLIDSVKDLMDRCDALMIAQVEIVSLENLKFDELEAMRKRLVAVANEASLKLLGLKNELSSMDHLYNAARTESLKWEKCRENIKATVNERNCNRERFLDGINHLYRLLCQKRSIYPEFAHNQIAERMDFIKDEVELMQEVLESFQTEETKNEGTSAKGKC